MQKTRNMIAPPEQKNQTAVIEKLKIRPKEIKTGLNIPQEVVDHVENNLVEVTSESSICVDGGYKPEEAMGELARAGGDLGISLALMASGFSVQAAFDAVLHYRQSVGQKYGWHSDTHVDPEDETEAHSEAICGCGHCNAAFDHAGRYGVEAAQVTELLNIIKQYQQSNSQKMRYVNLDREHQEKGIFVVQNIDITILPWDLKEDRQFFVYDQARDEALLRKIADRINKDDKLPNVDFDKLMKIVESQTNATLSLLDSSKGKPMYSLEYDNGVVTINNIGNAPEA